MPLEWPRKADPYRLYRPVWVGLFCARRMALRAFLQVGPYVELIMTGRRLHLIDIVDTCPDQPKRRGKALT